MTNRNSRKEWQKYGISLPNFRILRIKKKILQAFREKEKKKSHIKNQESDFIAPPEAGRQWYNIFKFLKEYIFRPRFLYLTKLSIKAGKPRTFSDLQGFRKIMSHASFPKRPLDNVFHRNKGIKTQDPGRER